MVDNLECFDFVLKEVVCNFIGDGFEVDDFDGNFGTVVDVVAEVDGAGRAFAEDVGEAEDVVGDLAMGHKD